MPFLLKQPSTQPRVLCASQIPPHNIYHDISDYPMFYEPAYYPACYISLFDNEDSVCQWLQYNLQDHRSRCPSCSFEVVKLSTSMVKVSFSSTHFQIVFDSISFHVSMLYVQNASFSFCRLYRRMLHFVNTDHTLLRRHSFVQTPSWLLRERNDYLTHLSAISFVEK
jgi:hypothetical protein